MIDRSKINGDRLMDALLAERFRDWLGSVDIVEGIAPPGGGKPIKVGIRRDGLFLRHVGFGTYMWDELHAVDCECHTYEHALLRLYIYRHTRGEIPGLHNDTRTTIRKMPQGCPPDGGRKST